MLMTILLFAFLFILGLVFTIPPKSSTRKEFLSWIQSFSQQEAPADELLPKPSEENGETKNSASPTKGGSNIFELRSVFATFDKNSDGYITRQELGESLKNIGFATGETDVADMIKKVDFNGDGLIDFNEFCQLFDSGCLSKDEGEEKQGTEDNDLKEAFDVFDGDKDGLITEQELGLVLASMGFQEGKKLEDCKEMIRRVDVDGDGMVNFDEFKRMMKSGVKLIPVS